MKKKNYNSIKMTAKILAALPVLMALMNMPKTGTEKKKLFGRTFIAHRGLFDNEQKIPENTLMAFERACNRDFGIELDVQMTKDQQLVVFHDWTMKRACGLDRKIADMTLEEIQQEGIFGTDCPVPLFSQVLELVDGRVPLLVEIKAQRHCSRVCTLVSEMLAQYQGEYCIESFHPLVLMWYRKNHPEVIRGQLAANFFQEESLGNPVLNFAMTHMLGNFLAKPDFISYQIGQSKIPGFWLSRKLYHAAAFGWTVRSQEQLAQNRDKFDYIIFDSFMPNEI